MKISVLLAVLLSFTQLSFGQHGNVDLSFNPYDTSLYANLDGPDDDITLIFEQTDGNRIVAGEFLNYNGQPAKYLTRITPTGALDPTFNQLQVNPSYHILAIDVQDNGKILVGGAFSFYNGISRNIVRLNVDGTVDTTFNIGNIANGSISSIKIQPDGKILVGGFFTTWNGAPTNYIVRLNTDGSIDPTFNIGAGPNDWISNIDLFSTGEIIIAGQFNAISGVSCLGYAKLNSNGNVSPGFTYNTFNTISNSWRKIQVQTDDKALLQSTNYVYRINNDGTLDSTFNYGIGDAQIWNIKLLSTGKIAVSGSFNNFNGQPAKKLALLNSDGTLDNTLYADVSGGNSRLNCTEETINGNLAIGGNFTLLNGLWDNNISEVDLTGATALHNPGINGLAFAVEVQDDDKIIVGGNFSHYFGESVPRLMRLEIDGELDTAFQNNIDFGPAGVVNDIYVLDNNQILIAGTFSYVNGVPADKIARLNSNGVVDLTFNGPSFTNGNINSIDVQPDGKILVAGDFQYVDGGLQYYVARLEIDGAKDLTFTSPLFDNVTFGQFANEIQAISNSKIMVSGSFSCCSPVVRLNSNGSVDNSFYLNTSSYIIYDFEELANGKYIIGGTWSSFGGHLTYILEGRNSNGTLDASFNSIDGGLSGYTNNIVLSLKRLGDDKILVSGTFPDSRDAFIISNTGQRETTFDVQEDFLITASPHRVWNASMQSDGRIIVVGNFDDIGLVNRNGIARLHRATLLSDVVDCGVLIYQFGNQTISPVVSGVYYDTLQSNIGSDSLVILDLTLNNTLITGINQIDSITLEANGSGYTYQWIDCDLGTSLIGENDQILSAPSNSSFAVIVQDGSCIDTSECVVISELGLYPELSKELRVYPNPTKSTILLDFDKYYGETSVTVMNAFGQTLFEYNFESYQELKVELGDAKGLYFIKAVTSNGESFLTQAVKL
ncbi:MAG: T9SS type A sorting domain-containing protein [Crocinitomicaceae bacterium]|nr:T9SS type A sorting domain-containing protein [Crocinitomicaceae bacterium]